MCCVLTLVRSSELLIVCPVQPAVASRVGCGGTSELIEA
jgi:hypothetical protein